MDTSTVLWISWALLSTFCAAFATLAILSWRKQTISESLKREELRLQQEKLTADRQSTTELAMLLDKAMGMLGTKDPLAFQQVQAMSTPSAYDGVDYDPSDEAEIARINSRSNGLTDPEDLDAEERSFLDSLGVDPFFLRAD